MRYRLISSIAVILGSTLLLSLPASRSASPGETVLPPGRFEALDRYIAQALRDYRVPGASVAVVEGGKTAFVKGYGVRDIHTEAKVDPETVFQLASVSKTFAGVAGGILVDAGKLNWDAPIRSYLPEFTASDPYVTRHLTMRDLLAHRTGWPKFTGDIFNDLGYSRAEVLSRLRYLQPAYSLREVAQYSNLAYFVAGEVTARIAGMRWEVFLAQRVFGPLGMRRSSTSLQGLAGPNTAQPYAQVKGVVRLTTRSNSDLMPAAGGVNSTASDMAHYLQFFLSRGTYNGRTVVKPETIAEIYKRSMVSDVDITEAPPISENTGYYYGLGIGSYDYAGYRVLEKGGALSGFRTLLMLVPERQAGIVVLANLNVTAFPEAVRAYYLEAVLLGRSPGGDLAKIRALNDKVAAFFQPQTPPARAKPFVGSLRGLEGAYENPLYGRCTVSFREGSARMECGPAKYRAALVHFDGATFLAHWPGATNVGDRIAFAIGSAGQADRFTDDALGTFTRVRHL